MFQLDSEKLIELLSRFLSWIQANVLIWGNLMQLVVIIILLGSSLLLSRRLRPFLRERLGRFFQQNRLLKNFFDTSLEQLAVIHLIALMGIGLLIYNQLNTPALLLNLTLTLLIVWVVIKLASSVILDRFWALTVSATAWIMAALSVLNVLQPMLVFLDKLGFSIGEVHLSVLSILKAGILLLIALRLGGWLSKYIDKQLNKAPQLNSSARVLISKTINVFIYFLIFLVVFNSVGIDFTALAVFGGALGVGIGFGLQKVVSNFISGIILLTDRSIKPGDVIQIGQVFGWISSLKGRYVSVVTRDGHEYLIPNEDLITQQVINWSYSNTRVRLKVPFGVSYKADPHGVRDLVIEAMKEMPRVLSYPPPNCLLKAFGDSSLDMELMVWIDDPKNGVGNIRSDILFKVWDTLKQNGVEIPFPQRDIHIINELPGLSHDK
ncbi:MAG: mechanosensitive ion channel [Candidatus Marinimicrobia bacterium]|nr:mechanosensitive ion channel [Candidatus Neomarinimicrobiota bacterium]